MQSAEHVRRLARELVLPDQADLAVQRPKYWTPAFCWRYVERCGELIREAPEDGLVAAEVCPELVSLTERETRHQHDRLQLRALAMLGTGYWATDAPDQAETVFWEAFDVIRESDSILQSDAAYVLFRFSYVLCCQGRSAQAIDVASQSVAIYREAPKDIRRRRLGEALAARGYAHQSNGELALAMRDWAEALACVDMKQAPRVFYTTVHNLAVGLMQGGLLADDLSCVERYVTRSSRSFAKKLLSVPKLKVCWIRGMIQMRFGSTRRGEATYRKTISGFLQLGEVVDVALVSVTLGKQLQREGRHEKLAALAMETNDVCEPICEYEAAKIAVLIWNETVVAGTVTEEVVQTTWGTLERASFERATGLQPDAAALPPRITVPFRASMERQIA